MTIHVIITWFYQRNYKGIHKNKNIIIVIVKKWFFSIILKIMESPSLLSIQSMISTNNNNTDANMNENFHSWFELIGTLFFDYPINLEKLVSIDRISFWNWKKPKEMKTFHLKWNLILFSDISFDKNKRKKFQFYV